MNRKSRLALSSTIAFTILSTALSAWDCCLPDFELYGEALYLQPNGNDLYYGVEADGLDPDIAVPALSPNWNTLDIDPNYHWGFEIGAKALFSSDTNIDVSWERYHSKDSKSFTAPAADGYMVGPFFDIGPNSAAYKIAQGKAVYHFDEVNLNFGKSVCLFENLHTNMFVGVSYAHIKQSIFSSFSNTDGTTSRSIYSPSKFDGVGPQAGLEYNYALCENLFISGNSIASCFIGKMKTHTTFESYSPELTTLGIPQPNTQNTNVKSRTQLVPGFEQKLGLTYLLTCNNWNANFEIGYRCQIYWNAVRTIDMTAPQVLPAGAIFTPDVGLFAVGFQKNLNNFVLSGPYATVTVRF